VVKIAASGFVVIFQTQVAGAFASGIARGNNISTASEPMTKADKVLKLRPAFICD
jgi:hypothetical protein